MLLILTEKLWNSVAIQQENKLFLGMLIYLSIADFFNFFPPFLSHLVEVWMLMYQNNL